MVDFKKLKENSGKASLEKLTQELQKLSTPQNSKDERLWYPQVDKAGNGFAVIRFLPAADDQETPFRRIFEHAFQGPSGSWYFENSLTTIGKQDPVSEYNSKLWNSGIESDKDLARKYKRKLFYICNIEVLRDDADHTNDGRVCLFKFGKKIFDKVAEAMNPQFPDEEPFNPFDLWEGANFTLKIRNVEGYRNYDKSEFGKQKPLGSDEEIEAICEKLFPINPFLAADQFKSYDELKAKFERVLGGGEKLVTAAARLVEPEQRIATPPKLPEVKAPFEVESETDDETTKWFASLTEDE